MHFKNKPPPISSAQLRQYDVPVAATPVTVRYQAREASPRPIAPTSGNLNKDFDNKA